MVLLLRWYRPLIESAAHVLEFAPHRSTRRYMTSFARHYVSLDLYPQLNPSVIGDITRLPFRSNVFGFIVCYHVLEHVPDDRAAMAELRRVLVPEGIVLLQSPHRDGVPTDEDPSAPPQERIRRFGQIDHVRIYGDDFNDRLQRAGLAAHLLRPVDVVPSVDLVRYGLNSREKVWVCRSLADGE